MYEEVEYDIKPEINGSTKIKIELTDPTEEQEFEEVILEEKYGIGNDHICLLCDIGHPTKNILLTHIASEHGMKFECSKCFNLFESDFALNMILMFMVKVGNHCFLQKLNQIRKARL